MTECPPDVFNHNIETVPRLYKAMRPGSDYQHSLNLLKMFKEYCPDVPTKCGLMVGIGETEEEVISLLDDLHAHGVDYVTIGQYLQPSKEHAPIDRLLHQKNLNATLRMVKSLALEIFGQHRWFVQATLLTVNTMVNLYQQYVAKQILRKNCCSND
jgi:lipoate synthase